MYCPVPLDKIRALACSAWLNPFNWEREDAFWKGNNIAFFEQPYKLNTGDPGLWLAADDDFGQRQTSLAMKIVNDEGNKAYMFPAGLPVVPGMMHLLAENDEVRKEIVEQLEAADMQGKWTDNCHQRLVSSEIPPFEVWNNLPLEECGPGVSATVLDRIRGVRLAYLVTQLESYKVDERYWLRFMEALQKLRENRKLWATEDGNVLQEAKRVLLKATGHRYDSFIQDMIKEEMLNQNIKESHTLLFLQSIFGVSGGVSTLPEYMSALVYQHLSAESRSNANIRVMDWLANRNDSNPWTWFARLQKQPDEIELYGYLNNYAREKERHESAQLAEEALTSQENLVAVKPEQAVHSSFVNCVFRALINDEDNIAGVELLRKGATAGHRKDIILRVIKECEAGKVDPEIIQTMQGILDDAEESFRKYNLVIPDYGIEINSFLVFLMSPMDEKRIREQSRKWSSDEKLAYLFHATLLGYRYLTGLRFQPFWEAVCRNSMLGEKMVSWLADGLSKETEGNGRKTDEVLKILSKDEDIQETVMELVDEGDSSSQEGSCPVSDALIGNSIGLTAEEKRGKNERLKEELECKQNSFTDDKHKLPSKGKSKKRKGNNPQDEPSEDLFKP